MFRTLSLDVVISLYEPCHSLSSVLTATRLLALLDTITGAPHQQVAKRSNCLSPSSFSQASSIMTEVIIVMLTRTGGIFSGVLHSEHSIFKKNRIGLSVIHVTLKMTTIMHALTDCHHMFIHLKAKAYIVLSTQVCFHLLVHDCVCYTNNSCS